MKQDQIRGSLLAGAAGDALGYAVEFIKEEAIFSRYGEDGITELKINALPKAPVNCVIPDHAIKMEAASRGKVVAAIKSGKLKTACLMIGTTLVFFGNLPFELMGLNVAEAFLYFATVMSIVSMVEYYNLNKKLIMDN